MSSQTQSDTKEVICTHCSQPNAASNTECGSCGKTLVSPSAEHPTPQSTDVTVGELLVGAAVVFGAAYGLWQAFSGSKPDPTPTSTPPRPPSQPTERVEGWVIGEIAVRTQAPILLQPGGEVESFKVNTMPPIYVGSVPIYPKHDVTYTKPVYSSPTVQFAFVLNHYPSGALNNWSALPDHQLDILWRSEKLTDNRRSPSETPGETPDLRAMVDDLVQMAKQDGWVSVGHGEQWYQHRLRKRYQEIGVQLKWK